MNSRYYSGVRRPLTTICCVLTALSLVSCAPLRRQSSKVSPPAPAPLSLFPPRVLWTVELGEAAPGEAPGFGQTLVYVTLDGGAIVASNLRTGERVWQVEVPVRFAPVEGDELVFAGAETELRALRRADGHAIWMRAASVPYATAPVASGGWVITVGTMNGRGHLSALRAADGEEIWHAELDSAARVPPSVWGDRVYVSTETRVTVLDMATGHLVWERRLGGAANEVAVTGDRVYVGSADKYFYALDLADGTVSWRWRTGGEVHGAPALDETRVYFVATDNVLRALDRWSGAQRWKRLLPFRPLAGPVRVGSVLLVGGTGAILNAYALKDGTPAGELTAGVEIFSAPHALTAVLPEVVVATRDLTKGVGLVAFTRAIDPTVLPMGPLPNATPIPPLETAGRDAVRSSAGEAAAPR